MTQNLIAISDSITKIMDSAAPLISAIRIGRNRHITGLIWQGSVIVTTDQALPALDHYTVVVPGRPLIAARPGPRDPDANLATLLLDTPCPFTDPKFAVVAVGSMVVVVGADADASPTVRLTMVHRFTRTTDGPAPVLDLPSASIAQGSLVLDPHARLAGLVAFGPNQEAMAIPGAALCRMLMPQQNGAVVSAAETSPASSGRRGWLGVALQPITVPEELLARAGQTYGGPTSGGQTIRSHSSGRMIVSVTKGGPAEQAGLRVGDVLLALNGICVSGPHALRTFLDPGRIGAAVDVTLLRDGSMLKAQVIVAAQPS